MNETPTPGSSQLPPAQGGSAEPQSTADRKTHLEVLKLEAELQKLAEEHKAMTITWWKRPIYIGALVPSLLALAALTMAFVTGRIETEFKLIQLRAEQLAASAEKLRTEQRTVDAARSSLAVSQQGLEDDQAALDTQRQRFEADKQRLTDDVLALESERATLQAKWDRLSSDARRQREIDALLSEMAISSLRQNSWPTDSDGIGGRRTMGSFSRWGASRVIDPGVVMPLDTATGWTRNVEFFRIARDIALSERKWEQKVGLAYLAANAEPLYLVVISKLVERDADVVGREIRMGDGDGVRTEKSLMRPGMNAGFTQKQYALEEWKEWRANHSGLIEEAMEPTLTTWRENLVAYQWRKREIKKQEQTP